MELRHGNFPLTSLSSANLKPTENQPQNGLGHPTPIWSFCFVIVLFGMVLLTVIQVREFSGAGFKGHQEP